MLSFQTILALQLIRELHVTGSRMSQTELLARLDMSQHIHISLRKTVHALRKYGWVSSGSKFELLVDIDTVSLYDLVLATDDCRIQLGPHIGIAQWAADAERKLPNAVRINRELNRDFVEMLKRIQLRDMLAGGRQYSMAFRPIVARKP